MGGTDGALRRTARDEMRRKAAARGKGPDRDVAAQSAPEARAASRREGADAAGLDPVAAEPLAPAPGLAVPPDEEDWEGFDAGEDEGAAGSDRAGAGEHRFAAPGSGRLDRLLAQALPGLSRTRLQQLVRAGEVTIDGMPAGAPSQKVAAGQAITLSVPAPEPAAPEGEAIPLHVVYEDSDLIVIDKPAGMVVHPAAGHHRGTLVNALIAHCGESLSGIGGVRRPGIVHRLDKDTSGLLVVAKTDRAHLGLAAQFADHGRTGPLERAYLALAWGEPRATGPGGRLTVEAPLARSTRNREKMTIVPAGQGRFAITHVTAVRTWRAPEAAEPAASLVRCNLETGRTHQIRVHLASIGHPILGDTLYGSGFKTKAACLPAPAQEALRHLGRQALHAAVLGFAHPATGEALRFESPLPPDMARLVASFDAAMPGR